MKPYFDSADVTLYHGDMREIVPQLKLQASAPTHPRERPMSAPGHDERQLLRDVLSWARANGYRYDGGGTEKTWDNKVTAIGAEPTRSGSGWTLRAIDGGIETETWVDSVRRAVDVLAALGVLPVEFSSAYQAGVRAERMRPPVHIHTEPEVRIISVPFIDPRRRA